MKLEKLNNCKKCELFQDCSVCRNHEEFTEKFVAQLKENAFEVEVTDDVFDEPHIVCVVRVKKVLEAFK